ncbi:MAG: NitT/TauT family transport system substrate-binding protein [Alphaproteobacteria bacterium]|jgi:ABC-type nitrate/sulfonate/bicarbonate transport system substrate-binding protein|nr:NitT/TauT family transport system substrate-binding protein [Alphaproteobacteria bacterium]MEA2987960.1 NitT/TauT family transport system substrate-binding protein [Alphaproteobacteria bacterium]
MQNIDKVSFPYRASTHLNLLHVVSESGSWQKHGLDVNYNYQISKTDAHRAVANGEVEFVGGNHISTYGHRARGDTWVYLGQTLNSVTPKLVARPNSGINSIRDLRGKKVGTRGMHPGLNDWLLLKQRGLDVDRDEVELISKVEGQVSAEAAEQGAPESDAARTRKRSAVWEWVRDGHVDAALLLAPSHLFAADAGLKVIDIEPLPMIWFTTISSSLPFVEKHPDIVERFLKGMIEGIHFFKTQPEASIKIIEQKYDKEGKLNREQATYVYQQIAPLLEPKLYPTMAAIANVYEEAKRQDRDAEKINPMALWDLHHIRRLDDTGYVDGLYASTKPDARAARDRKDPEFAREQERQQAKVIAAVKACGHPEGMECGCT